MGKALFRLRRKSCLDEGFQFDLAVDNLNDIFDFAAVLLLP